MSAPVPPIMLNFPESFETERLFIRMALPGDGAEMNAAMAESVEALAPWMPFVHPMPSPEQSERYVREARVRYLERTELHMQLYDKQTGAFIGCSGAHTIDWELRNFEIGYWIRTSCSGKGYIAEAVNELTELLARDFDANRIEIRCSGKNRKSAAVAERAGFKLDGVLRNNRKGMDGELQDSLVYAKVRGQDF